MVFFSLVRNYNKALDIPEEKSLLDKGHTCKFSIKAHAMRYYGEKHAPNRIGICKLALI
jgi:hypothetical protein